MNVSRPTTPHIERAYVELQRQPKVPLIRLVPLSPTSVKLTQAHNHFADIAKKKKKKVYRVQREFAAFSLA